MEFSSRRVEDGAQAGVGRLRLELAAVEAVADIDAVDGGEETEGKRGSTARMTAPVCAGGMLTVADRLCGKASKVPGEKTRTKLKPSVSH